MNFIPPDKFPYTTPFGTNYDTGEYVKALDKALEVSGYAEPPRGAEAGRAPRAS